MNDKDSTFMTRREMQGQLLDGADNKPHCQINKCCCIILDARVQRSLPYQRDESFILKKKR